MKFKENYQIHKRKGNLFFVLIIFFFIAGYIFFFSSNFWMPVRSAAEALTKLGEEKEWSGRQVSVVRWDYCRDTGIMEVELDIRNTAYDGQNTYEYSALDKMGKTLTVTKIIEETDWVILQISDVPERWSEISLRMDLKKNSEGLLKLYTNINDVHSVDEIVTKDRVGYQKGRFEAQIVTYQNDIASLQKEIRDLDMEKQEIQNDIERLQTKIEYQTSEQKTDTEHAISQAESRYKEADNEIQQKQEDIAELNERIRLVSQQIAEVGENAG